MNAIIEILKVLLICLTLILAFKLKGYYGAILYIVIWFGLYILIYYTKDE